MKKPENTSVKLCNCSGRLGPCPLDGSCLKKSIIYKAQVTDENSNVETYTGLTSTTFKKRFYKHNDSFNKRDLEHSTTLSTHIWKLKDQGINYDIKWSIIGHASPYNPTTGKCRLCIKEKFNIIFKPEGASLNKRSELFSTCRHRKQKLLINQ